MHTRIFNRVLPDSLLKTILEAFLRRTLVMAHGPEEKLSGFLSIILIALPKIYSRLREPYRLACGS